MKKRTAQPDTSARKPSVNGPRPTLGPYKSVNRRRQTPARIIDRSSTPFGPVLVHTRSVSESRQPPRKPAHVCPNCSSTEITDEHGSRCCKGCGLDFDQSGGQLVSENTFVDGPNGATQVQGQFVGAGQTHARSSAPGGSMRPQYGAGFESQDPRQRTITTASRFMNDCAASLRVPNSLAKAGEYIFGLAYTHGLLKGRTIEIVAAVCFYIACRRDKGEHGKYVMLIDLAEKLQINVFVMGSLYTTVVRKMWGPDIVAIEKGEKLMPALDQLNEGIPLISPEGLVERFAKDLDFPDTPTELQVKRDAVKIVRRMNRDWITTGRRPSGVVGAAVIIASRMNNLRRSVREVVLVAKVTEITINKRLEEFQNTQSGELTVAKFRESAGPKGDFAGTAEEDPPAFAKKPKVRKEKRPKKRKDASIVDVSEEDTSGEDDIETLSADMKPAKRLRVDKDGYAIPERPTHPQSLATGGITVLNSQADHPQGENLSRPNSETQMLQKRGPGRPRGAKTKEPPQITAAETAIEEELTSAMEDILAAEKRRDEALQLDAGWTGSSESAQSTLLEPSSASTERASLYPFPPVPQSALPPGPPVNSTAGNIGYVSLSPTISPAEFDEDPEVSSCLLSDAEKEIKERIWQHENAEWLRKENVKRIKIHLEDAEMRRQGLDPETERQRLKDERAGRKRAGKIGEAAYMDKVRKKRRQQAANGEDDGLTERERNSRSASEAVVAMLQERGKSKKVNYAVTQALFGNLDSSSESGSRAGSVSLSREGSVVSAIGGHSGSQASPTGFSARAFPGNSNIRIASSRTLASSTGGRAGATEEALSDRQRSTSSTIIAQQTRATTSPVSAIRPAPQRTGELDEADIEIVEGEDAESPLSAAVSSQIGMVPQHVFADSDEDDDGEGSEMDPDEIIEDAEDDVEAAFLGRARRAAPGYDDDDDDDDEEDEDEE